MLNIRWQTEMCDAYTCPWTTRILQSLTCLLSLFLSLKTIHFMFYHIQTKTWLFCWSTPSPHIPDPPHFHPLWLRFALAAETWSKLYLVSQQEPKPWDITNSGQNPRGTGASSCCNTTRCECWCFSSYGNAKNVEVGRGKKHTNTLQQRQ